MTSPSNARIAAVSWEDVTPSWDIEQRHRDDDDDDDDDDDEVKRRRMNIISVLQIAVNIINILPVQNSVTQI